jgi:dynein heavy chain 1
LLDESATKEKLKKFITDAQTKTLLIQRYLLKEEEEDSTTETSNELDEQVVYSIVDEVVFGNPKITSIVLIKKSSYIEADKLIYNQICEMILSDSNPYGTLHSYITSAVAPYFKSYVKETRRAER